MMGTTCNKGVQMAWFLLYDVMVGTWTLVVRFLVEYLIPISFPVGNFIHRGVFGLDF
jgi:hypothetical protein